MPGPVERFVIGFGILYIAPGGDAGFAALTAELLAMFFAVIAFISHSGGVLQGRCEFRSRCMIADIPWSEDDPRCQPAHHVNRQMAFGVEAAS